MSQEVAPKFRKWDGRRIPTPPVPKEKGPNGHRLCRWCWQECPNSRRYWCSEECVADYKVRNDPQTARASVRERDRGKCADCGIYTEDLEEFISRQPKAFRNEFRERMGVSHRLHSLWDLDHIVPVAEGGGLTGLENLATLCVWCHRRKTARQASVTAEERRRMITGTKQPRLF